MTRRVKSFHPATWSKKAVQHDIKMLVDLVNHLDKRGSLWQHNVQNDDQQHDEQEGTSQDEKSPHMETNKNPEVSTRIPGLCVCVCACCTFVINHSDNWLLVIVP